MLVRQANKLDANQLAKLIFTSAPNLLSLVFTISPDFKAMDFLRASLTHPDGQYGYANHWVIENNQQVVACISAWTSEMPSSFHQATLASLVAFYSADDVLEVLLRGTVLQDCIPQPTHTEWCIGHVAVADKYQRQGLGKTLLTTMQQHALEQGKSCLSLDVDCTNSVAINFYLKQGFKTQNQSIVSAKMRTLGIGQHLHMAQNLTA